MAKGPGRRIAPFYGLRSVQWPTACGCPVAPGRLPGVCGWVKSPAPDDDVPFAGVTYLPDGTRGGGRSALSAEGSSGGGHVADADRPNILPGADVGLQAG